LPVGFELADGDAVDKALRLLRGVDIPSMA